MKLLVIGFGGREHALIWKLIQELGVTVVWCLPGNAGIAMERLLNGSFVQCVPIGAHDVEGCLAFALEHKPDLTIVGPELPLALGIADAFRAAGLKIFGVGRIAAQFEASKVFSHNFMQAYGIPTAEGAVFYDPKLAKEYVWLFRGECVVKADGLHEGKGVGIARNIEHAHREIDRLCVQVPGSSFYSPIVIQKLLEGKELSSVALHDGKTTLQFPSCRDHKRFTDSPDSLNTGGVCTFSPVSSVEPQFETEMAKSILDLWQDGKDCLRIDYRGAIYPGLILTREGSKVLEFNARFGDPETQAQIMRLESSLLELLLATVEGRLAHVKAVWKPNVSVCVVLASAGYPKKEELQLGKPIYGLEEVSRLENTKVFHAATVKRGEDIVTSGGRVLGVTGSGINIEQALDRAYDAVHRIHFEGMQYCKRDRLILS